MGGGAGPAHYWLLSHPVTVRNGEGFISHSCTPPLPHSPKKMLVTCDSLLESYKAQLLTEHSSYSGFFAFYLKCLGHQIIYPPIPYSVLTINRSVKPLAGLTVENPGGVTNIKKHLLCSPPKLYSYLFILIWIAFPICYGHLGFKAALAELT